MSQALQHNRDIAFEFQNYLSDLKDIGYVGDIEVDSGNPDDWLNIYNQFKNNDKVEVTFNAGNLKMEIDAKSILKEAEEHGESYKKALKSYQDFKATPHNPCASVMRRLNFVESQFFVRLPKFDAGGLTPVKENSVNKLTR